MTKEIEVSDQTQIQKIIVETEVDIMLAKYAQEQSSEEKSGATPFLSIKGKKFSVGDTKLGSSIDVVILSSCYDNSYYDKPYEPDVINPPACFAIGTDQDLLVPHDKAPAKVSDTCLSCPYNEFESAPNGKGKACKNGRRLLVASMSDGKVDLSDLAILRLPPTSLKAFSTYTKSMTTKSKRPLWSMVTTLTIDQDSDWPKVQPVFKDLINDKHMFNEVQESMQYYYDLVSVPYDVTSYVPPDEQAQQATAKRKSKMS